MCIWELKLFVWQILLICKVQLKYFSNGIFPSQPLHTKLPCPCCHQKVFALTNNTDFHPSTISFLLIFIWLEWNISPNPADAATAVMLLCPRSTGELAAVLPKQWQQAAPTCIYPNETEQQTLLHFSVCYSRDHNYLLTALPDSFHTLHITWNQWFL